EIGALHIREERAWRQRQDERDAEQERRHQQALAQAAAEHDRILRNAIEAAETEALKQERERKQKEEEERRVLEAERSAKAAREAAERQRKKEELERQELEQQKRAAEEREIQEQEARLAQQKRQNEADALRRKQEQEASERKAKEEADAAAAAAKTAAAAPPAQAAPKTQQSQPQPASTLVTQPSTVPAAQPISKPATQIAAPSSASGAQSALKSTPAQLEAVHNRYLAIHKSLKKMREKVDEQSAPQWSISDYRRKINTVIGQFTPDKVKNRVALKRVLETLNEVLTSRPEPTINVTPFLANPPDNSERHMPLALVYLLNLISKLVINQFCSDNIATIDALAIVLVTVFSKPEYLHNGTTSLIDILLAKYHVVCPVLFGIYGNEKTDEGKQRIGWWEYVSLEDHKTRMAGLATG
ncbi:GLE1-domain-containing protein, partial [Aureobasidium melanogenum]